MSGVPDVMKRPETRYAKSGDVHIAYQVVGEGVPGEWRLFAVERA